MHGLDGLGSLGDMLRIAALVFVAGLAAGCAANTEKLSTPIATGLGCVDDSLRCRNHRRAALNALMADKKRSWVRQPPNASAYASGVRLFAFKKRKRELSCVELGIGQREAKAARPTLRAAAKSLTPGQIARGAMLGDEVGAELKRERRRRRCKA
ncbi:MAG: hypothetical protein ACI89J_001354 [Hyphomicrobiaceae bacterium]|jgi:hypothetical protein